MKRKGKKDADIDAACKLFSQVRFTNTKFYPDLMDARRYYYRTINPKP